jgi:hypothetical protein
MKRIDTMQDFLAERAQMQPVYIQSRTRGQVLVPCANTLLVKRELVVANTYNPNAVSSDKMELLQQSVLDNGFCFPIVTIWDDADGVFVIIDGFHRSRIGSDEFLDFDYLPVVVLSHDMTKRMAATVQFNKARGVHAIDLDADVVRSLIEQGLTEQEVAQRLGMELDAVHRYKQVAGVAALFANSAYSSAWEMVQD